MVEDVHFFPIMWGKQALLKQVQLCEEKIRIKHHIAATDSDRNSMTAELRKQVKSLEWQLENSLQIKDIGGCYGMDWVITARLKET